MKPIVVTLPDGSTRQVPAGTTLLEFAKQIGRRLEEAAVAGKLNGKIVDLTAPLNEDCQVAIITRESADGLEVIRHSTAHLLAMAVKELFPETQVTIGPVTEDGFYYDFDRPTQFVPEDLPRIEKKMEEIAGRKLNLQRKEHTKAEVIEIFKGLKEDFKVEIIKGIPEETLSTYSQGEWVDLCRGPHVPNTARLGKFKLLSIAGAYWRGDEKNKMLQRIYGTAFATQKELDDYLHRLEEAKKRDHRKLGPEMGLFNFLPIAPAMPFFLPKGAVLYNNILQYMRQKMLSWGYDEVICPQMMSGELWKTSGHLGHYQDNMFCFQQEDHPLMALKPMNCPGHASLYNTTKHSYRELPIRWAEFSRLHRFEKTGVTHGLLRVRQFSQDDAHIFCMEEQIQEEITAVIKRTYEIYERFGFTDVSVKLATRPESFAGTIEDWDKATQFLHESLKAAGQKYDINEGDGAFYGPKIEFHIRDSLKRSWQCGTVQVDYALPERFGLEYVASDGKAKRPVMLHRAIVGSFERFMGILIEHHAGHFPFWVAPLQVMIINVTDGQAPYATELLRSLGEWGYRAEADLRHEKLGYRIRDAQLKRAPLMVVLGQKEMDAKTISVRRSNGETLNDMTLDSFKTFLEAETNPGGTAH